MYLIRRFPAVSFFVMAYLFTWLFWIPMALSSQGILPEALPRAVWHTLGVVGPALSAAAVTYALSGRDGVRGLVRRLVVWRVPAWTYGVALGSRALVLLGVLGVVALAGGPVGEFRLQPLLWVLWLVMYSAAAFGEETGWRGWAVPALQARWGPLAASLVIGVLWSGWHLPMFYTVGFAHHTTPFMLYLLNMTAFSVLFTWVYNNTEGSIFMAALFHGGYNLAIDAIPVYAYHPVGVILPWVAALAVVAFVPAMRRRAELVPNCGR